MSYRVFYSIFILLCGVGLWAQEQESDVIQFSGLVLDGTYEDLLPVPFANVFIRESSRGTYSDFNGFFSIVAKKGQKVEFSAVGYKTVEFVIPDTLEGTRYSMVQLMTKDTLNLPEAVIFPWPSRENLRLEFLAMDVESEMQRRAMENLSTDKLLEMRNKVGMDANENADYYLRKQSKSYYYIGQTPPMNIFNPISWKQFFDAWKRGDFKKKQ